MKKEEPKGLIKDEREPTPNNPIYEKSEKASKLNIPLIIGITIVVIATLAIIIF